MSMVLYIALFKERRTIVSEAECISDAAVIAGAMFDKYGSAVSVIGNYVNKMGEIEEKGMFFKDEKNKIGYISPDGEKIRTWNS